MTTAGRVRGDIVARNLIAVALELKRLDLKRMKKNEDPPRAAYGAPDAFRDWAGRIDLSLPLRPPDPPMRLLPSPHS